MTDYGLLAQQLTQTGAQVCQNEPLAAHTTFRIGGPARLFCRPQSEAQLAAVLARCRAADCRVYLLGRGSNTLFADEGFDGAVIALGGGLDEIAADCCDTVVAGCGATLAQVCLFAAAHGLGGLEFAYGIPGSVGGAVYMNAGAYGGEMKDVLARVRWLTPAGELRELEREELCLGYRTSRFEREGGVILSARFALAPSQPQAVRAAMDDFLRRRTEKQPLELPSAGSTFKRPQGAYAAALIEQCGLKGFRIGGAAVSEKHSGFVVNLGGATAVDVLAVADAVSRTVLEKTGYRLEKEIRVVR